MKFRVAIIGTSQAGKSTVGVMLDEMCGGGYFETSDMLKEGLAKQLWETGEYKGHTYSTFSHILRAPWELLEANTRKDVMDEVMRYKADKIEYRKRLFDFGIEKETNDPLFTVAEPLRRACFVAGTRTPAQLGFMRDMVDWVIYVQKDDCPPNNTDLLKPEDADLVIENNGTFLDLRRRLEAFLLLFGPGTSQLKFRRANRRRIEVDDDPEICDP